MEVNLIITRLKFYKQWGRLRPGNVWMAYHYHKILINVDMASYA